MGAAGNVNIYKLEDLETKYKELWPDNDLRKDWWYLDTITVELDGTKYVCDYADDQGMHQGSGNNFWFDSDEVIDKPEDADNYWDLEPTWDDRSKYYASQYRVLKVLGWLMNQGKRQRVEVWT